MQPREDEETGVVTKYGFSSLIPFLYPNFWSLILTAHFCPWSHQNGKAWSLIPEIYADPDPMACDPRSHPFNPWSHIPHPDAVKTNPSPPPPPPPAPHPTLIWPWLESTVLFLLQVRAIGQLSFVVTSILFYANLPKRWSLTRMYKLYGRTVLSSDNCVIFIVFPSPTVDQP